MATLSRKSTTGSTKSSSRSSSNSRSAEKVDERRSLDENRSQMEGDGLLKDALHSDAAQHVKAAQAIEQSASVGSSRGSSFEDKMQSVLDDAAESRSAGASAASRRTVSEEMDMPRYEAVRAQFQSLTAGIQSREQLDQGRADLAAHIEVEGSSASAGATRGPGSFGDARTSGPLVGAAGARLGEIEDKNLGMQDAAKAAITGASNNSASRESGVSVGYSQGVSETAGTAKSWSAQSGRGELDGSSESASYGRSASMNSAASGVETSLSVAECSQQSNVERITVGQALDELDPRSGDALLNGQKISNSSHETISRSFEDDNGSSVREGLSSERSVTYDLDEGAGDVVKTLKQSFCETSTQTPSQSLGSESAMDGVGSDLSMLRSQESAGIREQALESLQQTEQARNNQEPEAEAAAEAEEEMDMSD